MSNPPFRDVEALRPLCGAGLLYFVFLVLLRMVFLPFLRGLRLQNTFRRLFARLAYLLLNLVLIGGLLSLGLVGFLTLTGGELTLDVNLDDLTENVSLGLVLLLLVALVLFILVARRSRHRGAPGGKGGQRRA